ncbi:sigma-70 family RNA polymerase sigma factor [Candidatus Woesearchaeota archaeon]|nr:sigma-70 family RNA polymerase sigma factor [Candidatus Woesearchaeota archaeon]
MDKYSEIGENFEVRVEARLKNAALVKAREKLGLKQIEAAKQIGIYPVAYNAYECMREYPTEKHRFMICDFYTANGIPMCEDEVFPVELRDVKLTKRVVDRKISKIELISLTGIDKKLLPSVNLDEGKFNEKNELNDTLEKSISNLPSDLQMVIRLRYGIDDGTGEIHKIRSRYITSQKELMTLDKVGDYLNISREAVRQTENKAIKKLRKPPMNENLRIFLG